jgi:hypothetical protein
MPAVIVLQAIAIPKHSHQTATWYSVIHHFKSHVSSGVAFTGEMFGLWAAASPLNTIPLNSRHTGMVLAGQFIALQNSRVIVSLDVW